MSALAIAPLSRPLATLDDDPPCPLCPKLEGDIAELQAELQQVTGRLAKAHQVLRAIKRIEPKPARPEGFEDDPAANAIVGYASALAAIRARIDLYLASEVRP